jgi:hypothetical protein
MNKKSSPIRKKTTAATKVFTSMAIAVTYNGMTTVQDKASANYGKPLYKYRILPTITVGDEIKDLDALVLETFKAEKNIDPQYNSFTTMYKYKSGEINAEILLVRELSENGNVYWNEDRDTYNFIDQDPELKRDMKMAELARLKAKMQNKITAAVEAKVSPVKKLAAKKKVVKKAEGLEDPFAG